MPYNSVTEHPGPLKLWRVRRLIFGLVSKSVVRISKFALIKKLEKKLNFLNFSPCKSRLWVGKCYQDMWKYFRKITIAIWNFCKILKIFLLPNVEITFFNRLYLRNGASWTPPQTFDGLYTNFRSSIQIRCQNFKIRFNKKVRKKIKFFKFFGLEVKARAWQVLSGDVKNFSKNHQRL